MQLVKLIAFAACTCLLSTAWGAPPKPDSPEKPDAAADKGDSGRFEPFKPEAVTSAGSVSVGGQAIPYQAIAGTLVVHPKGWDDVPHDPKIEKDNGPPPEGESKNPSAEAAMFYAAYFKGGKDGKEGRDGNRPITFFYNGGPGSSTVWLHLGAFGPRRILTSTDAHTPAAPYSLVNNASSLLDATDMVFIRCARDGLQPDRRQGQGEGVFRRRSGCLRIHGVRYPVPHEIRPLELAEISVR